MGALTSRPELRNARLRTAHNGTDSKIPALYDQIGKTYRATRAADPRIVERLLECFALPEESIVCDVGAGSGNYTNALAGRGFRMIAIEPSATMRSQAKASDRVRWIPGVAESIPLPDRSCAGVVCTLAAHHFSDMEKAAAEMQRVAPEGPMVFFTVDPRRGERLWFDDYFPEIRSHDLELFPALDTLVGQIARATGRDGSIETFALPNDLIDNFLHAPWNKPERYLDASFRDNTSGFARAGQLEVARGLARLRDDLTTGAWDRRYGELRQRAAFDAGYRFVVFRCP